MGARKRQNPPLEFKRRLGTNNQCDFYEPYRQPSRRLRGLPLEYQGLTTNSLAKIRRALEKHDPADAPRTSPPSAKGSARTHPREVKPIPSPPPPRHISRDSAADTAVTKHPDDRIKTGISKQTLADQVYVDSQPGAPQAAHSDRTERWVMADTPSEYSSMSTNTTTSGSIISSSHATSNGEDKGKKKRVDVYTKSNFSGVLADKDLKHPVEVPLVMAENALDAGLTKEEKDFMETLKKRLIQDFNPQNDKRYGAKTLQEKLRKLVNVPEVTVVHRLQDLVCPTVYDIMDENIHDMEMFEKYSVFAEHWSERWNMMPKRITGFPYPAPDYCVGFSRDNAFSREQRNTLATTEQTKWSHAATLDMLFPFLTCEAKASKKGAEVAERQNAYSMMVAVQAMIDLFRAANMQERIDRKTLAFSLSYNNEEALLYAYYPVFSESRLKIHRTIQYKCDLINATDDVRWQSWHFVRNIYDVWAPGHLELLLSAIDSLAHASGASTTGQENDRDGSTTPRPSQSTNSGQQNTPSGSEPADQIANREGSGTANDSQSTDSEQQNTPRGSSPADEIDKRHGSATPTASQSANSGLQSLSLQSPARNSASQQSDNGSVRSSGKRDQTEYNATSPPLDDDSSSKRQRTE